MELRRRNGAVKVNKLDTRSPTKNKTRTIHKYAPFTYFRPEATRFTLLFASIGPHEGCLLRELSK